MKVTWKFSKHDCIWWCKEYDNI